MFSLYFQNEVKKMSKKISFGKISLAKLPAEDQPVDNATGFGTISSTTNIPIKEDVTAPQTNASTNSKNAQKTAKKFDVEKIMTEFQERVEKTKISQVQMIEEDVEGNEKNDMMTLMGFSGFGKVDNTKKGKKKDPISSSSKKKETVAKETVPENKSEEATPGDVDSADDMSDSDEEGVGDAPPAFPVTHEIKLQHSVKAVTGLALDPAGARLVTGSQDFDVKFWDFNAMDSRFQSFRTIQPMENYHIRSIQYSARGDMLLLASGGPQAKVLDRDGKELYESKKGDQYLHDMSKTKGHTSAVYNAVWHTKERNHFLTCASDSTVRLWDINKVKEQITVIKLKGRDGKKINPTHCSFNPDSSMIAVATMDGVLSLFPAKGPYIRPKACNKSAHQAGTETSCLRFSADGTKLLSRGGDDTMKLWDVRKMTEPVFSASGLENVFEGTGCCFSPDEKFVMTGTSVKRGSGDLVFFDINTFELVYRFPVGEGSVASVLWHPKLNQIVAGCSNGVVKVYYCPTLSSKGALLCAAKQRRRAARNEDQATALHNQIINPYSLPMFREQRFLYAKRRKDKARRDPVKSAAPDKPAYGLDAHKTKGCSMSAFVSKQLALDAHGSPAEEGDPREALLKLADKCEADPYWIAPAYGPETKNVYQKVTEETLSEEPPEKKPMYFYNK